MATIVADSTVSAEEQTAFLKRARASVPQATRTAASLAEIKIADFQSILRDDEAALLLARDDDGGTAGLWLTRGEAGAPALVEGDVFLEVTGRRRRPNHDAAVAVSLCGLGDSIRADVHQFFILPEAEDFAKPFVLRADDRCALDPNTRFFVAPSLPWLAWQRQNPWRGRVGMAAWMGEREHPDGVLRLFRLETRPVLRDLGVEFSDASSPKVLAGAALAIIGLHGRLGVGRSLAAVTDTHRSLAPSELASLLEGCGCVVLCVCSGGHSIETSHSMEAKGIVPELLSIGTRAVIAPLRPISVRFTAHWVEVFVRRVRDGLSVGQAAQVAGRGLSGAPVMRVFGDGEFHPPIFPDPSS